jgi:probable HAF family extracellular repeat protein
MKVRLLLFALAALEISFVLPIFAQSGKIIIFDAPGAATTRTTSPFTGTVAYDINDLGQVVGSFNDAQGLNHGFVRYADGRLKTIDAPGAGAGPGQGTVAYGINIEGEVVGEYNDSNNVYHGFLREPGGHLVTFDAPGAANGQLQGTHASDINARGTILGIVVDRNNVFHGYLRPRAGAFTLFNVTNAGSIVDTFPASSLGLNELGVSTGVYFSVNGEQHGYVRQKEGTITSFDPPGSTETVPESINLEGAITGTFVDVNGGHGFIRRANGAIISLDVPGAFHYTNAVEMTPFGVITGIWGDSNGIYHGFVRYPNGAFIKFDAPGSGTVPQSFQGTSPQAINFWGEIVGQVQDSNYIYHGFIRLP